MDQSFVVGKRIRRISESYNLLMVQRANDGTKSAISLKRSESGNGHFPFGCNHQILVATFKRVSLLVG